MKAIYLTLFIILFAACTEKADNNVAYKLAESNSTKKIGISDETNLYSNDIHYYKEPSGVEYLSISNADANNIAFYRLDSCKLSHIIRIKRDGKYPINIGSHGVINLDDIFITTMNPYVYRINRNGDVIKNYNLMSYCTENRLCSNTNCLSLVYNPLVIINGKIYCPQDIPPTRWNNSPNGANFEFDECPLSLALDTATGTFEALPLGFPELFDKKDGHYYHNEGYSRIYDGKQFVFSFCALSGIYVTQDFKQFASYPAISKLIGEIANKGFNSSIDIQQGQEDFLTKAEYGNILYDQYREVYYRFCYAKSKKKVDVQYYFENALCREDFSIQIINKDFQVVGETMFKAGKYAPKIFFVNDDGLWLSENNFEREDMDEDTLVFRCFKLQEMQE